MRYGWNIKVRSNFSKESAIWILGKCYHQKTSARSSNCEINEKSSATTNSYTRNDNNKLLTTSLHEELPTSCDSYAGLKCRSTNDLSDKDLIDDQAFEPPEETGQDVINNDYEEGFEGFKRDFISKIWMTYRRDFAVMQSTSTDPTSSPTNGYTSDCGWGCMIRSGQMMLANALIIHFLGRCWRYDSQIQMTTTEENIHRKIIRWFGDQESKTSPFSIHKIVKLGKKVGQWYGPQEMAHVLKDAVKEAAKENVDLASLHVYVAQDCTIYNQDIFDECYSQEIHPIAPWQNKNDPSPSKKKGNTIAYKQLILLIPLRLGQEKLNQIYEDCLKAMLSLEWCIGIIGGKTHHSLYFVGYQEEKLIHLDPHYCQDFVDVNSEHFPLKSFHCTTAKKMKISKMDPSCCIGFYIPNKREYGRFQELIKQYLQPVKNFTDRQRSPRSARSCYKPLNAMSDQTLYPMFIFQQGRLRDQTSHPTTTVPNLFKNLHLDDDKRDDDIESNEDESEDFVIL